MFGWGLSLAISNMFWSSSSISQYFPKQRWDMMGLCRTPMSRKTHIPEHLTMQFQVGQLWIRHGSENRQETPHLFGFKLKKINVFCMRMVHQASESSLSSLPGLSCDKDLHHTWGQGHVLWSARQARPKHILYQQVVPAKKYGIFKQTNVGI